MPIELSMIINMKKHYQMANITLDDNVEKCYAYNLDFVNGRIFIMEH